MKSPVVRTFDCHVARLTEDGYRFLLMRRAPGKQYAGSWRMVAGKLEEGETAWQACVREVVEETQLKVTRLLVVPYVNRFYEWEEDRINDIPVFLAIVDNDSNPKLDDEHEYFTWLAAGQAISSLRWAGQREGLRAAVTLLENGKELEPYLEVPLR